MNKNPVIIDCDTGRDDALSIWLALALGLDVRAVVASYGNTILDNVCENSARVLALAGREDIALWRGQDEPSRHHSGIESVLLPKQRSAGNGLCNLELPRSGREAETLTAAERASRLLSLAEERGPVDYVILGPATNFSTMCKALGAQAEGVIARVTMMGGKFSPLWEAMPGADFNVVCDPWAVQELLQQGQSHEFPVRFVPMNVTWPIVLDMNELTALRASTAMAQTATDLMIAHARHFAPEPVFRFHDPCVILSLLHNDNFRTASLKVICEDSAQDFGRLWEDNGGLPADIFEVSDVLRANLLNDILLHLGIKWS